MSDLPTIDEFADQARVLVVGKTSHGRTTLPQTIIEPGAGNRFVKFMAELATICEGMTRLLRDPDIQRTGAQFLDTIAARTNIELGTPTPTHELESNAHADD